MVTSRVIVLGSDLYVSAITLDGDWAASCFDKETFVFLTINGPNSNYLAWIVFSYLCVCAYIITYMFYFLLYITSTLMNKV